MTRRPIIPLTARGWRFVAYAALFIIGLGLLAQVFS